MLKKVLTISFIILVYVFLFSLLSFFFLCVNIRIEISSYYTESYNAEVKAMLEATFLFFLLTSMFAIIVACSKRINRFYKNVMYSLPLCSLMVAIPLSLNIKKILNTEDIINILQKYFL